MPTQLLEFSVRACKQVPLLPAEWCCMQIFKSCTQHVTAFKMVLPMSSLRTSIELNCCYKANMSSTLEKYELACLYANIKPSTVCWCPRAQDLPPYYPAQVHAAALARAQAYMESTAQGPARTAYIARLTTACTALWQNGRQQCGALSMTGRACGHLLGHDQQAFTTAAAHAPDSCSAPCSVHQGACAWPRATAAGDIVVQQPDPFTLTEANEWPLLAAATHARNGAAGLTSSDDTATSSATNNTASTNTASVGSSSVQLSSPAGTPAGKAKGGRQSSRGSARAQQGSTPAAHTAHAAQARHAPLHPQHVPQALQWVVHVPGSGESQAQVSTCCLHTLQLPRIAMFNHYSCCNCSIMCTHSTQGDVTSLPGRTCSCWARAYSMLTAAQTIHWLETGFNPVVPNALTL